MGNGQTVSGLKMASNVFKIKLFAMQNLVSPTCSPKGRNSARSNDDKEGIGESKKRMTIGNRLYRGLKIASIRKDADLLYGILLYERRYDL